MMKPKVKVFENEAEVQTQLCKMIEETAAENIRKTGRFVIGVSGGSLAKYVCSGLVSNSTEWCKWVVVLCDERVVPFTDPDSNYKYYLDHLKGVAQAKVLTIRPDLPVSECASDYASQLRCVFPSGEVQLDLALLGMGPDGHTCSLFPHHQALQVVDDIVTSVLDSPKPPPSRVTLTLPVLNQSKLVVFVSTGGGKQEMLKKVLDHSACAIGPDTLPSARVRPVNGDVVWFVDKPAAALLSHEQTA